ncbi:DNA double-strand break repair nuclease NurA [Acidianus sp. HS-5]|uniref:DNA double-strand break repair nuclease NurA n=1 Tax=Acidianus sp. HS-5 TaxID=2886040 RepID=UPI001F269C46|nr:DNA double-strand break repair nuclease NurA [Acidianus sp. HS-5]BDC18303.1 hypothetical protein HS5_11930 [Acidianus sp. HS-5]
MIEKAYEEFTNNYSKILEKIRFYSSSINDSVKEHLKKIWINYEPEPVKSSFIAIDGGEFVKELRVGTVFLANAEAVYGEGVNVSPLDNEIKMGVFRPGNLAKERVSEIMSVLELSLALRNGNKAEYVLMDGSLKKKLGNGKDIEEEEKDLDEIINCDNEERSFRRLILKSQILICRLIQNYDGKVLWVSKNSRGRDLFGESLSDIAVIESLTENPGFTLPFVHTIDRKNLVNNKEVKSLEGTEITSFYVRLEKGQRVLKVDLTGRIEEEEIKKIINNLHSVSIKGYPYPLLKVHYDVKVNKEDRQRILSILGLNHIRGNSWWPNQFF